MGNLTGTEGIHLPKYVQGLGFAMAECSYTHKVHLARRSNDTHTRRILSFWPSDKGRFIAELAWDQKKYSFDITPRDGITFLDCGNAVVRAVKNYAPGLPLEGEELFISPPMDIFMTDKRINTPSRQSTTILSDEPVPDDNHVPPHEDTPIPCTQQAEKPFMAPADIWNARTLALYHTALEWMLSSHDQSEYLLIDNHHGKIRALTEKMVHHFSTAPGSIHRALDPLRQYKVIEKEMAANNIATGWWIVRFVTDAPPAEKDLKILWDSRKHQQSRPLMPVSPARPHGSTIPVPEPLNTQVKKDQPRESDIYAPIPDEFDTKIEKLRALQISLRGIVREETSSIYTTIAEFCRKQNEELARQQERFADFLTPQDFERTRNVCTALTHLLETVSEVVS